MSHHEPTPKSNEDIKKRTGIISRFMGRRSLKGELAEARWQIRHDEKTGLLTDIGLEEAMQDLLEKSEGDGRFMLVQIDLDNFGQINKEYDQPTGDMAIKIVADILSNAFRREGELISRSNKQGDEFRLILPLEDDSKYEGGDKREHTETNSQYLTRILRTELQRLIESDKDKYDFMRNIDFSIGDATYRMSDITLGIDELSKVPDARMQQAKMGHKAFRRDSAFGEYSI